MPSENLISVVMPLFYSGSCLQKVLEALYDIDYPKPRIETIFPYYPSKDSTLETIREFRSHHDGEYFGITILECQERGLNYARNLGIRNSRGNYIFFLDDDVALCNETLHACIYQFFWKKGWMDAGCGKGRKIMYYSKVSMEVIGLEPFAP